MTRKQLLILMASFLLIAAALGAWLTFAGMAPPGQGGTYEISPLDRTLGNPKAKVVLIEYGALTCPHCAIFNNTILPLVKRNYIDTGKVFYVYRLYRRVPEDAAAQKLALCAREKYFDAVDLLYRNQDQWDPENGVIDVHGGLLRIGRMMHLSAPQVDACIADSAPEARIADVKAEAESRYDLQGVPFFLVNGTAQDWRGGYPEFAEMLDKASTR